MSVFKRKKSQPRFSVTDHTDHEHERLRTFIYQKSLIVHLYKLAFIEFKYSNGYVCHF